EAGLGARGVYIGTDLHGGSFVYYPWLLYARGILGVANTLVLGMPDFGKSSLTKSWLYRSRVFGRRCEIVDPKGEYSALIDALGRAAARERLRELALALMRLCRGPLRGMFDGPSTEVAAFAAPVLCLDISDVAGASSASELALAITMVCATAFLDAERAGRVRTAAETGAEPARTIRVNDEAWRALPVAGLGEYYQAAFKLARQTGVQHWMVLH